MMGSDMSFCPVTMMGMRFLPENYVYVRLYSHKLLRSIRRQEVLIMMC